MLHNFGMSLRLGRNGCVPIGWQPWNLGASLKTWWSANDHGTALMTDDGSGLISLWVDRVGGTRTTAATTARPTWASASVNSLYAGLTFDGTANCLATASWTALPSASIGGDIWSSFSQSATAGVTTAATIFRYGGTTAQSLRSLSRTVVSTVNRAFATDSTTQVTDTFVDLSGLNVAQAAWFGTSESIAVNGTTATVTASGTLGTTMVRARIGANNAGTAAQFLNGIVRHVITTLTLATADQQRMAGWLAWDMNLPTVLPVTNPYRYARP